MTLRTQEVLRDALALRAEEPADVAAEFARQSGKTKPHRRAWAREIERHARRVIAGEWPGEAWEDVRQRTERGLASR
jgi:hypothetical protein